MVIKLHNWGGHQLLVILVTSGVATPFLLVQSLLVKIGMREPFFLEINLKTFPVLSSSMVFVAEKPFTFSLKSSCLLNSSFKGYIEIIKFWPNCFWFLPGPQWAQVVRWF